MPDPSGLSETVLYVCTTCRAPDDASARTAGARLLSALREQASDVAPTLRVEGVPCLSVCKRPCTVAVAAPGRWTYVYGDLDADASAATILAGIGLYAGTEDGIVPWRERPEAFRKGVVARIPPLASAQSATDAS